MLLGSDKGVVACLLTVRLFLKCLKSGENRNGSLKSTDETDFIVEEDATEIGSR